MGGAKKHGREKRGEEEKKKIEKKQIVEREKREREGERERELFSLFFFFSLLPFSLGRTPSPFLSSLSVSTLLKKRKKK